MLKIMTTLLVSFITLILLCTGAQAKEAGKPAFNTFADIENFQIKLEELDQYWEKITKNYPEVRNDSALTVPFSNTQMVLLSTLPQTMSYDEQASWKSTQGTDPEKNRIVNKTITKKGTVYDCKLEDIRTDTGASEVLIHYDSARNCLETSVKKTDLGKRKKGKWHRTVAQCYLDSKGGLYYSECFHSHRTKHPYSGQMVAYFNGKELYYAVIKKRTANAAQLSIDLFQTTPESWDQLLKSDNFEIIFSYDGRNLEYKNDAATVE